MFGSDKHFRVGARRLHCNAEMDDKVGRSWQAGNSSTSQDLSRVEAQRNQRRNFWTAAGMGKKRNMMMGTKKTTSRRRTSGSGTTTTRTKLVQFSGLRKEDKIRAQVATLPRGYRMPFARHRERRLLCCSFLWIEGFEDSESIPR